MIDEKLIFTNSRGQSISFGNAAPFILLNHDGTGGVQADIQRQKSPFQDGVSYIDTVMQERPINFQLVIMASNQNELFQLRSKLVSVLNPKFGEGKLVYQRGEMKHEIKAAVELAPVFPNGEENRGATFQVALVSLLCPSPFWEDMNEENYKLEDFVGNFRFSFRFPVRFSTRGDARTLLNKGDVPTPIHVEFRGRAVNPKITNMNTGEFIKVNREIPEGYKLILDTAFGDKRVEIVAPDGVVENAFHYIDLESTFFSLDVGETRFGFISESGRPEVYVKYKHRYVGV